MKAHSPFCWRRESPLSSRILLAILPSMQQEARQETEMRAWGQIWQLAARDSTGATLVEYSMMAGLIAAVAFAAVAATGRQSANLLQNSTDRISSLSAGPSGGTGGSTGTGNNGNGNGGTGNNGNGSGGGNNGNGGGNNK